MKADCHTHSIFSSDGELSIEKMTATALEKGLSYLAVTDHVDFDALLEKTARLPIGNSPTRSFTPRRFKGSSPLRRTRACIWLSGRKWASTPILRRSAPQKSS